MIRHRSIHVTFMKTQAITTPAVIIVVREVMAVVVALTVAEALTAMPLMVEVMPDTDPITWDLGMAAVPTKVEAMAEE